MNSPRPKATFGLPVFNGENYLAGAIDSILAQTFTDFELLITDNASTDRTEGIARDYAARDSRVRYHRNESNLGAYDNFMLALDLARGEYFKWAAHDDLLAPDFLEKCVEVLDSDHDVVLCYSLVSVIDADGREMAIYDSGLQRAASPRQSVRFAALTLVPHVCTEMFGLCRPEALKRTQEFPEKYHGWDRAMLAELSLLGRFAEIPEPLFMNREHAQRYVRAVAPEDRPGHAGARRTGKVQLNSWLLYTDYLTFVRRHAESSSERLRCYGHLVRWWFVSWNSLRFGAELVSLAFPRFYGLAKRAKDRLVRPAHPTVPGQGVEG